jgi:probable F420-dependent oxidoreductase
VSTSRPFRFAVQKRTFDDPNEIGQFACHVESLGFEELYSYDHIGTVDPFVPLIPAALATERLRVGPLVLNNELHQPALLARTAATVDRMIGGRLVLGLGTGYAEDEHQAIGLELRPPGPRVTRFGECVEIVRSLLDTDAAHVSGIHHTIELDALGVRPVQAHVPFLIGGFGKRVVTIAARYADIFQFTGLSDLPGGRVGAGGFSIDQVIERGRWLTDAAGDRDGDIERSALVQMIEVGDDVSDAAAIGERFEIDPAIVAGTPFVLSGSVEQLIDKLERTRQTTGISHYVVRDPDLMAPVVAALADR